MSEQLVQAVDNLTTQTTALLDEYRSGKTQMVAQLATAVEASKSATSSASAAATSATSASSSATTATNSKNSAKTEADRAKTEADRASQIAGLDTVEAAVALALGTSGLTVRTKADMDIYRAVNEANFAASGMVHMGLHADGNAVNEGITTYYSAWNAPNTNRFWLGRKLSTSGTAGNSVTEEAVLHCAGMVFHLDTENSPSRLMEVRFAAAPNGTVSYDTETGIAIDYAKTLDPKYGDIAGSLNEAVARAFGGLNHNADFRMGDNAKWQRSGDLEITTSGAVMQPGSSLYQTSASWGEVLVSGKTYRAEIVLEGVPAGANVYMRAHTDGALVASYLENGRNVVEFTYNGETNPRLQVFVSASTPSPVTVKFFSLDYASRKVVTERTDAWGFEVFLAKISPTNPYVYKYGSINSLASSMEGVATSRSNRPDSYYAAFTGDTGGVGKGVNFFALTADQRKAVAGNPKHHIYLMPNGDYVQWRVRQRAPVGAGNGEWAYTDSTLAYLGYDANSRVPIQGDADTVENWVGSGGTNHYYGATGSNRRYRGCLTAFNGAGTARNSYDGEAYFYVGGFVPRLNQGVWHQGLNPYGTASVVINSAGTVSSTKVASVQLGQKYSGALMELFKVGGSYGDPYVSPGRYIQTGSLLEGSNFNGVRPDGKLHDAIYSSGLGGVIDMRLSAHGIDTNTLSGNAMNLLTSGNFRGRERLPHWVIARKVNPSSSSALIYPSRALQGFRDSDGDSQVAAFLDGEARKRQKFWIRIKDWGTATPSANALANVNLNQWYVVDYRISNGQVCLIIPNTADANWISAGNAQDMIMDVAGLVYKGLAVSGEYMQTDMFVDPEIAEATASMRYGWQGTWSPQIPQAESTEYVTSRRFSQLPANNYISSGTLGQAWSTGAWVMDAVKCSYISTAKENFFIMLLYMVKAKFVKNSAREQVYTGVKGTLPLYGQSHYPESYGALLYEGMLSKYNTSSATGAGDILATYPMNSVSLDTGGRLNSLSTRYSRHDPLPLVVPNNNSSAMKFMPYLIAERGLVNLGFVFNEMRHNGTAWGDTGTLVTPNSESATFTDANGVTCIAGNSKLTMPLGWINETL